MPNAATSEYSTSKPVKLSIVGKVMFSSSPTVLYWKYMYTSADAMTSNAVAKIVRKRALRSTISSDRTSPDRQPTMAQRLMNAPCMLFIGVAILAKAVTNELAELNVMASKNSSIDIHTLRYVNTSNGR